MQVTKMSKTSATKHVSFSRVVTVKEIVFDFQGNSHRLCGEQITPPSSTETSADLSEPAPHHDPVQHRQPHQELEKGALLEHYLWQLHLVSPLTDFGSAKRMQMRRCAECLKRLASAPVREVIHGYCL
jgi:hypothetical protein